MAQMFSSCSQLSLSIISNFNTSNVTNMGNMFKSCSQLSSLNLSNFYTSKVTNMAQMFSSCSQLTYLNLKNFIENNSLDITNIFGGVPDNIVVCLHENNNNILNHIKNKKCYNIDCSDNYNKKI